MFFFTFHKKLIVQNHIFVDDKVRTINTYDLKGTTYVIDAETNKLLGFGVGQRNTVITSILQGETNG